MICRGVLFLQKRINTHFDDYRSYNINFRKYGVRLDELVPVMTIQDIHYWLE